MERVEKVETTHIGLYARRKHANIAPLYPHFSGHGESGKSGNLQLAETGETVVW